MHPFANSSKYIDKRTNMYAIMTFYYLIYPHHKYRYVGAINGTIEQGCHACLSSLSLVLIQFLFLTEPEIKLIGIFFILCQNRFSQTSLAFRRIHRAAIFRWTAKGSHVSCHIIRNHRNQFSAHSAMSSASKARHTTGHVISICHFVLSLLVFEKFILQTVWMAH